MPFSERQLHCLHTMGVVPWVDRHAAYPLPADGISQDDSSSFAEPQIAAAEPVTQVHVQATVPAVASTADFASTPLVALQHRGQSMTYIGSLDAALLILVEATSSVQAQFPFEATDARMFEDMLRGIGWRRQDVCLAVLDLHGNDHSADRADGINTVGALLSAQRRAILIFSHNVGDSLNIEDVQQNIDGSDVNGWRLPHPALLRSDPQRKRLAWNVLKAARARLVRA